MACMPASRISVVYPVQRKSTMVAMATWLASTSACQAIGSMPNDRVGGKVARTLLQPSEQRDRLTPGMHIPASSTSALGRLERALQLSLDVEPVLKKLKDGVKSGRLPKARPEQLLDRACEIGLLTDEERKLAREAEAARAEAVAVDSFTLEEYKQTAVAPTGGGMTVCARG